MRTLLRLVPVALVVTLASTAYILSSASALSPMACTMDAKMCPDGSYVGRDGFNNCEWEPCPGEKQACTKELKICPDGTGVGRTGPNCEFEACPGASCEPYVCANGKTHPRCTDDGTVINYFAAPCHMDGGEVGACTESECGPAMGMPNWQCPDGSVGGPACMQDEDGACGWRVRDCPNDSGFEDVPTSHENADAVFYVKSHGLVEGYADGTYRPDATINRAEFVKILMGAFEDDGRMCKIAPFADIDQSQWYAPFAHAARCNGIVEGYPDGTFRPANTINFVEAAKILAKAYELEAVMTIPACEDDDAFECPWYRPYVLMLEMKGAIPTSISRFGDNITRGEMAEMIYRLRMGGEKQTRTYEELANANATLAISLYFGAPSPECADVSPVTRNIPKTPAVADAALRALLAGPTEVEKEQGLWTPFDEKSAQVPSLYPGPMLAYYQGVTVAANGMATVKLSRGGSDSYLRSPACLSGTMTSAIFKTLTQFPTITNVQYSVDGTIFSAWDA